MRFSFSPVREGVSILSWIILLLETFLSLPALLLSITIPLIILPIMFIDIHLHSSVAGPCLLLALCFYYLQTLKTYWNSISQPIQSIEGNITFSTWSIKWNILREVEGGHFVFFLCLCWLDEYSSINTCVFAKNCFVLYIKSIWEIRFSQEVWNDKNLAQMKEILLTNLLSLGWSATLQLKLIINTTNFF